MKAPDYAGAQACLGKAALFERVGSRHDSVRRDVCHSCPVIPACFTWAVEQEPIGFWAGLNASERARIRTRYGIRAAFDGNGSARSDRSDQT